MLIHDNNQSSAYNSVSTRPAPIFLRLNPKNSQLSHIEQGFPEGYWLSPPSCKRESRTFYDTFAWQAYHAQVTITHAKGSLRLSGMENDEPIATVPFNQRPESFFPSVLPEGPARTKLEKICGIRSLIRLCTIEAETCFWRILDSEEKTIGTMTADILKLKGDEEEHVMLNTITLRPLRGYQDEVNTLADAIQEKETLNGKELFDFLMQKASHTPGSYSSKIRLQLHGDATTSSSARQLLQFTLATMRSNEEGIRQQFDTEFLHDYRVAIRGTRSVLALLKEAFDPHETDRFRNAFRELGKKTNIARDLDVYLLAKESFIDSLPDLLKPPLDGFFRKLEAARRTEQRKLVRHLDSQAYRTMLEDWERCITSEKQPGSDNAAIAGSRTEETAGKTIRKAWKKLLRHGRNVSRETTDEELHALRIDCKKLRYLLEFFASLYQEKTIDPAVKHLKELQENLGTFVDCSVQQEFLAQHLNEAAARKSDPMLTAALGGLLANIHSRKEEARMNFHATFNRFNSEETENLFEKLLNT